MSVTSSQIKTRKKAVMEIVTSKDVTGIPRLEVIAQNDPDPKIRKLAKEGIAYLQKFIPEEEESESLTEDVFDEVFADVDLTDDREMMLPSDFPVTELEEKYAKGLVGKAIDAHVHSNRRQAIYLIKEALLINPRLMYDEYTMNAASSFTGKDGQTAIRMLSPDVKTLKQRAKYGSALRIPTVQRIFVGVLTIGWLLIIVGAFFMPWGDLSAVALINQDGETEKPVRFDMILEQIHNDMFTPLLVQRLGEQKTAELRSISIELNGNDMSQIFLGRQDVLSITGLRGVSSLFEIFPMDVLGLNLNGPQLAKDINALDLTNSPSVSDFSVLLFPLIAVAVFVLMIAQYVKPTRQRWFLTIILGLLSMLPVYHFYTDAEYALFPTTADFGALADLLYIPPAEDLIGLGFWVTGIGIAFLIFTPIAALIQQRNGGH